MELLDNITCLKGIGTKKAQQLNRLGLCRIFDLLTYYPRAYEDQSSMTPIAELVAGEKATVQGLIRGVQERRGVRNGLLILTAVIDDGTGTMQITWFNQRFLKQKLKIGKKVFATGKIQYAYGGQGQFAMSQLSSFEVLEEYEQAENKCGIMPVYSSSKDVNQKLLRGLVMQILQEDVYIPEVIPEAILEEYGLPPRRAALQEIHFPSNQRLMEAARYRLAFEELYMIQCGLLYLKKQSQEQHQGVKHGVNGFKVQELFKHLPFSLTKDQNQAWHEICNDMERSVPMRRLLQGDVGSGKTVVAMLALVKTVENGFQGAMMAPTEILAHQHYDAFCQLLEPMGIRVALLSGKLTKKQRTELYEKLASHEIDIAIGTHALIQEGVVFANLGLVVTDEQHRFGINQRALLEKKGVLMPDVLVMTATPIPRTMTLTVYGDLDVSLIQHLPPGRKPIRTFIRGRDRRPLIYDFVLKEIGKGRQAYVVCPLIELNEESSLTSAQEVYEELSSGIFRGVPCGLIHGKLKPKEKEAIMQAFYDGEIKLLVATTVIEVGVNVPNASMMVIEHAQQFGLAQLHQLRGRIGRGEYASYCVLVADGKTESSRERMRIMESTSDGFVLAEEDLKLRGPGQFFGTMQHGFPDLKIANVEQDMDILLRARQAAAKTLNNQENMRFIIPTLQLLYQEQFLNITDT